MQKATKLLKVCVWFVSMFDLDIMWCLIVIYFIRELFRLSFLFFFTEPCRAHAIQMRILCTIVQAQKVTRSTHKTTYGRPTLPLSTLRICIFAKVIYSSFFKSNSFIFYAHFFHLSRSIALSFFVNVDAWMWNQIKSCSDTKII